MEFCQNCGSFMELSSQGYICPKCGAELKTDTIEIKTEKKGYAEPIYEMQNSISTNPLVRQSCPQCDSTQAYREVLTTQGEHAGVKQERSLERYTCAECGHTWTRS